MTRRIAAMHDAKRFLAEKKRTRTYPNESQRTQGLSPRMQDRCVSPNKSPQLNCGLCPYAPCFMFRWAR